MSQLSEARTESPERIFACDTEVKDIDVRNETPRGHGSVVCFSVYCGKDAKFGEDSSKTILWVDTNCKG